MSWNKSIFFQGWAAQVQRQHYVVGLALLALGAVTSAFSQQATGGAPTHELHSLTTNTAWARDFFQNCAFVCVDIQPGQRSHMSEADVPKLWHKIGFTAADVNAATDYAFDVAYPNARKVVDACRDLRLPMIFVHWGCLFRDGMDLDPEVRKELQGQHGTNYLAWGHCVQDSSARPAEELGVRPGEYVLPKSGQDAFRSSNIGFLLTNLHVKNIVFIGGHTEACLGKTAQSARQRGFRMLCVEDATFNARESTRRKGIKQAQYDYVVTTAQFLKLAKEAAETVVPPGTKNATTPHPN
jgi:nicotinamidase-related amidase